MEYRRLGESGLQVSVIALGTNTFGGQGVFAALGNTDVQGAKALVGQFVDGGGNLIDTADEYSAGAAETILGHAIRGVRERVLIATKVGTRTGGVNDVGQSRRHVIAACERSLARLGVTHIDVLQAHTWDGLTPPDEMAAAYAHLIEQGKVRYAGLCNFAAWQATHCAHAARAHGIRYVSHQVHYSPLVRDVEPEILPAGMASGTGTLVWGALAGGMLTGKHRRGEPPLPGTRYAAGWAEPPLPDAERTHDVIDTVSAIARERGVTPAQVTLAWVLGRPGVTSVITGARTAEQLTDNLLASDLRLTKEEADLIEGASRPPVRYPGWHHLAIGAGRLGTEEPVLHPYA